VSVAPRGKGKYVIVLLNELSSILLYAIYQETVVVPDVHKFDGHIACDDSSNSEIVVPMYTNVMHKTFFSLFKTEFLPGSRCCWSIRY
jgi:hypothetical protein